MWLLVKTQNNILYLLKNNKGHPIVFVFGDSSWVITKAGYLGFDPWSDAGDDDADDDDDDYIRWCS